MRPDMKNDRYEISNRFEFCFCLHQKSLIKRRKFLVKPSESILYETDVCFKRKKHRREIWVFWSEHSRKWEIYFVFCVTENLRHVACSVIEMNICSQQNLQEITIKQLKKIFTAINKGYFKWDYYHFSCFHAQACAINMRRAIHIGYWNFRSVKKLI